jgi:hypothetical protein
MKKHLLTLAFFASAATISAQLYSPNGAPATSNASTGNVGIGVSSPTSKLQVDGDINSTRWGLPQNSILNIGFNTADKTNGISNYGLSLIETYPIGGNNFGPGVSLSGYFGVSIFTSSNERMRIDGIGNVGIGTISPSYKLTVHNSGAAGSNQFALTTAHNRNVDRYFMKNIIQGQGVDDVTFSLRHDGQMFVDGNVGIGTNNPQYKLDVIGKSSFSDNVKIEAKLEAKEIKVTLTPTADFVFEENYNLPKLEEVEKHIKEKKHLPEIASAKEMEKEGVNVGEFQIKLLQKIEELTLYTIEQNKLIKEQQKRIEALENKNK